MTTSASDFPFDAAATSAARRLRDGARLGLVYGPTGRPWHLTHSQNPFVQWLRNGLARVHVAGRDSENRSRGAWAEFALAEDRLELVRDCAAPSLELGELGAFDDSGAMPGSIVEFGGRTLMFYTGWTRGGTVPFHFHIGLAESVDGGETFERVSRAPVLGRNPHDPFITGAPWVLVERGRLRMWYSSATSWQRSESGEIVHFYAIKHATSSDGLVWETDDRVCIGYRQGEHAIARPVVTRHDGFYRMIYSARRLNGRYEIFQAYSPDGLTWQRVEEPVLRAGGDAWDSEMVCYGFIAEAGRAGYLLYNGNDYGRAGFGAIRLPPKG